MGGTCWHSGTREAGSAVAHAMEAIEWQDRWPVDLNPWPWPSHRTSPASPAQDDEEELPWQLVGVGASWRQGVVELYIVIFLPVLECSQCSS